MDLKYIVLVLLVLVGVGLFFADLGNSVSRGNYDKIKLDMTEHEVSTLLAGMNTHKETRVIQDDGRDELECSGPPARGASPLPSATAGLSTNDNRAWTSDGCPGRSLGNFGPAMRGWGTQGRGWQLTYLSFARPAQGKIVAQKLFWGLYALTISFGSAWPAARPCSVTAVP